MLEDTPPQSPSGDSSTDFMSEVRTIWGERPFWIDDNGRYMGQIRDSLDDYLMTISLGLHPSDVLFNMHRNEFHFDCNQEYNGWEHYQT